MNPKAVKKHILEELAHGKPVQTILNPQPPMVMGENAEGGKCLVPDPDWVKPDLPDWNLVVQWLKDEEEFRQAYEHAMKYGAVYLADEMLVLKDALLKDPKSAPAYKAAMDAIRTSAMWRDAKYSERTIQEVKNTTPQDPTVVSARIKQLEDELGLANTYVPAVVVEPKKVTSEAKLNAVRKAQEARRANAAKLRKEKGK